MRQYATCFDRNYMAKGVALYRSLVRHSPEPFILRVLVIDDSEEELAAIVGKEIPGEGLAAAYFRTRSIGLFPLSLVADDEIMAAKTDRTHQEFCWSLASWWTRHVMRAGYIPEGETRTYLDADMFFFSDPTPIHEEIGKASVAILPHHFAPEDEARLLPNGKYCVSWVTFRNDETGRRVLDDWTTKVLERCKNELRNGGIGDQGYLNDWPETYPNVHVIENRGLSLAPWNLAACKFISITLGARASGLISRMAYIYVKTRGIAVAFHFHEFCRRAKGDYVLTGYKVEDDVKRILYDPYIAEIEAIEEERC